MGCSCSREIQSILPVEKGVASWTSSDSPGNASFIVVFLWVCFIDAERNPSCQDRISVKCEQLWGRVCLLNFHSKTQNCTAGSTASYYIVIYSQFDFRSSTLTTYHTPILHSEIAPNSEGTRRFKAALSLTASFIAASTAWETDHKSWISQIGRSLPLPQKRDFVPMKRNKEPIGCGFFGFALDIPFFFSWPLCIDWVHTNSLAPLDLSPPLVAPWSARTRRKKGLNFLEWDDPVAQVAKRDQCKNLTSIELCRSKELVSCDSLKFRW